MQALSRVKEEFTMRACGILMPVFSLPGPFGIGTLGKEAFAFVDFLARAKQTYWQILPIGPTGYGDSPYQSFSAFAGNPYFIDFRVLHEQGYLTADEIPAEVPVGPVDYGVLYQQRPVVLQKAADRLLAAASAEYKDFCTAQSFWLDDYALFMAVKAEQGQAGLCDWPDDLRTRQPAAVAAARERLAGQVDYFKAVQFFFAILKSANMSLGINTLMKLLKDAANVFAPAGYDIEIVEKHHNQKVDAPSGTAIALADSINEARGGEYEYVYDRSQVRKKRDKKELGISAVRGGTIVGEHEVIFAGIDEVIEFKHTAYSKSVFAKGAVEAAKFLAGKPAGMYDMADVIG